MGVFNQGGWLVGWFMSLASTRLPGSWVSQQNTVPGNDQLHLSVVQLLRLININIQWKNSSKSYPCFSCLYFFALWHIFYAFYVLFVCFIVSMLLRCKNIFFPLWDKTRVKAKCACQALANNPETVLYYFFIQVNHFSSLSLSLSRLHEKILQYK